MNKQELENNQHYIADDEIDLVDLFLIVWKRKWMIVTVTVLLTVAAAGVTMLMPKVYEVSAILEPARNSDGSPVENPQSIRENIISGTYDKRISVKLSMDLDTFPKVKVSVPKQTNLVKLLIESSEPDRDTNVLNELLAYISGDIVAQLELKKEFVLNEIRIAEAELSLFPQQIKQVEVLIAEIRQKVQELNKVKKEQVGKSDVDSMAILLYLNEIQNQQVFLANLYRNLAVLKRDKERFVVTVSNARLKLAGIMGTTIKKQPTISENPIKPKKTLIVALAFILGLMGGIMLAFLAEFMTKVRQQQARSDKPKTV